MADASAKEAEALLVAASANDADALASLQRLARGSGGGRLCGAVAALLRRETLGVVSGSGFGGTSPRRGDAASLKSEAEFPRLAAAADAPRVLQPRRKGAAAAPPPSTPVKRAPPRADGDDAFLRACGGAFGRAARRGWLPLAASMQLAARALSVDGPPGAFRTHAALKSAAAARRFAAWAVAELAAEVGALPGRALRGAIAKCRAAGGCEPAADALERVAARPSGAAAPRPPPRDLSVPFDYDRDSRHAFAGEARAFAGRERCRDALLGLLRDYCRAKGDAEALEKLLPPRDDAFYFFGGAPRPEKPRRRSRGPAPREAPSLRDRARELWGALPPESARWFAGLLDATLVRAVGEGAPPARGGPAALADGDGDFFYLFAAAADSHRLNHALVDALDAAAAEDHARLAAGGRGGAADRAAALAARATLCGQVRSLCGNQIFNPTSMCA